MKPLIRVGLVVTGLLVVFSLSLSILLLRGLFVRTSAGEPSRETDLAHFSLFVPNNRNDALESLINGAKDTATALGVALSIHPLDTRATALHMARWTKINGVIIFSDGDENLILSKIETLRADKIPVVLINHNIHSERPWPFVGTNNFDLGKKASSLINKELSSELRIAVLYTDKNPAVRSERELVEMGVFSGLNGIPSTIIPSGRIAINPRDAENRIYELVRNNPKLHVIIFTDPEDTLAGTQALVDLNLVGRVQIIGYGDTPEIREYIRKGIINGSLSTNARLTGEQAVQSLLELYKSGYTSNSVDIGIDILTKESIKK
ncbi:MAG TPA: substrate-binding domain-containing protein [Treponemataceae bacterium]|nr:substrate-binding domain-containing protein [Treponemataceae bacterium]